jgi:cytochrome P450
MWLAILLVIALVYLLLILRPGSSWHVEQRLQASGILPVSPWRVPLYGNLTAQELNMKALMPTEGESTKPCYFVSFGKVFVSVTTFRESAQIWHAMLDWPKDREAYSSLDLLTFGPSMVATNGDAWHSSRTALNRCFSKENMELAREMVMQRTDEMLERWKQQRTSIDVLDGVTVLTYGVILEFVFGRRVSTERIREGMGLLTSSLEMSWDLTKWPITTMLRMLWPFGEFAREQAKYKTFLMSFIEEAKRNPPAESAVIRVMLDQGWTDEKMLSECAVLLFAGTLCSN